MKRITLLCAAIMMSSCILPITANATESPTTCEEAPVERTVGLINQYSLIVSGGNKKVSISGYTLGYTTVKKIGFKNIKIQKSSDGINWSTEKTVPDLLLSDSSGYYLNGYQVNVNGGYYYRVACDHYAKDYGLFGATQTEANTSSSIWVN